jgi:predicted NBD/HSP70 family sugar kinase
MSAAIGTLENLLDPEAVILGGAMPDLLLDHLIAALNLPDRSVSHRADRSTPRVLRGTSGRMTATLGAAALVINRVFTPTIAVAQ